MAELLTTIVLAMLGSSGLSALLIFLIQRKDKKKCDTQELRNGMTGLEIDSCRTQMLVLMSLYPEETAEIMKLAKHYFADLDGDFYMSSLFVKWLHTRSLEAPIWWQQKKE